MTPKEYASQLETKLADLLKNNKPLRIGAYSALADMSERIFTQGNNSNGSPIGQYNDSTPIYVSPNQSPKKFPLKGKAGKTTFSDGSPHKTGYFDSYKAFRSQIGRRTDTVNLQLTGDFKSDLENPVNNIPTPLRVNMNEYEVRLKRPVNELKRSGLEDKYGTFTRHTSEELTRFYEVVEKELALIFTP